MINVARLVGGGGGRHICKVMYKEYKVQYCLFQKVFIEGLLS